MSQLHAEPVDGASAPGCEVLVVGCGNLLRGDDGVGPVLIRQLWERGLPEGVQLVDGGTAGMDVAFKMRGVREVVLIDASRTGARPGTVYRVPGPELADLPPLQGLHTHSFRWDHALAFANWLLKDQYPKDVTVFLIEAESFEPGADLTPSVSNAMDEVLALIEEDFLAKLRGRVPPDDSDGVEFTGEGYVRLGADLAARKFPGDAAVALRREGELWLVPLRGTENGGLLLKRRTVAGDRSVLIREVLGDEIPVGRRPAVWDPEKGALRIPLELET